MEIFDENKIMVYKNKAELPVELRRLPVKAQNMFMKAFNSSITRTSEEVAYKVAWSLVKKQFKKVDGKWIARGMGHSLYTFDMTNKGTSFIKKDKDGEYFLEAVLTDTMVDEVGTKYTEATLIDYAKQINEYGIAGFITHADWDEFCTNNLHLDEEAFVARARTERKGIFKTIKAIYEKGKLWIKALIDKRYVKQAKKFNKVSIEALVPEQYRVNGVFTGGQVLGVALTNTPLNPRSKAKVYAA